MTIKQLANRQMELLAQSDREWIEEVYSRILPPELHTMALEIARDVVDGKAPENDPRCKILQSWFKINHIHYHICPSRNVSGIFRDKELISLHHWTIKPLPE